MSVSIRDVLRSATTYAIARKETPIAERSNVCYCVDIEKVAVSEHHKALFSGKAADYVKRKKTLFLVVMVTPC